MMQIACFISAIIQDREPEPQEAVIEDQKRFSRELDGVMKVNRQ